MESEKKRIVGIDLLRLLTMYMIVLIHMLNHGGIKDAVTGMSGQYKVIWAMETLVCCAVNVYAIISGYVGYTKKQNDVRKFGTLWFQVFFYSVFFYLLLGVRMEGFSLKQFIKVLFPVTTTQYWYFTAYAGVYLISPWVNRLIRQMEAKEAKRSFCLFMSVLAYVSIVGMVYDPFKLEVGYSVIWLTVLYILGAFMRKLEFVETVSTGKAVMCLAVCWCGSFLMKMLIPTQDISVCYTFITTIGMSIALIVIFSKMRFTKKAEKIIRAAAPAAFGVYLIHDNKFVRAAFMSNRFEWISTLAPWKLVMIVWGIGLLIFAVSMFIHATFMSIYVRFIDVKMKKR